MHDGLSHKVTDDEIKAALWSMKAFKAPELNGLHAGFFQCFLLIIGSFVREEVKKIFRDKRMSEYLNKTHIALIPKVQGLESCSNYRPISLCNFVYKIITKIIVARLRPHLNQVISPFQTAFVPDRKGIDNAIIVQELIHTISRAKGKEGYMVIKVDLEKAYDKLEWSFIGEMLFRVNFPSNLIQLIMSCVTSVSTSILFHGGVLDSFHPSRGIKQGDPLSPYLFIMCMDFLGQLIEEKCSGKFWNSVKASRNGLAFSHLVFADDVVLFAKANLKNYRAIRKVLETFYRTSGQSVGEAKTRVFFSPNVDQDTKESL